MALPPIAYLASRYPAVSHTFIEREVRGLRRRGAEVTTFAIRPTSSEDLRTDVDQEEAATTVAVLPATAGQVLDAHLAALRASPGRYLRTLLRALRLSGGGLRSTLWQLFYFAEAGLLWRALDGRGIRHVHAHFANVASDVALLGAALGGPGWSWSFTMHGPTEFDDVTAYRLREKVRDARFVACIGDYCRSQLMKLVEPELWPKLSIVRCGVDAARFVPVDRTGRGGPLQLLCLGRLVPDKGQGVLVEAVAQLVERGIDVRLTLAGDGPDRAALERRVRDLGLADAVRFVGAVGQDRVLELYAEADVFCLASFAEGIPVVLMEAMARGLPVVTTRIMGVPELVLDGSTGLLVAPGRAAPLATAIETLAADPDRRARLGQAAATFVADEFGADAGAAAMWRCLDDALDV